MASRLVRDEMLRRLANWGTNTSAEVRWPDIELDDLLRRIIVEGDTAHASLIAYLRPGEIAVAK